MSNVVRLVNGGTIQVRTGVIQGIGPQGPRGVAGPQGLQGEQGPTGPEGPIGQILQSQGMTAVSTNNPLAANSDVTIAFGSIGYDDLSAFTSTSNITLVSAGDYLLSCWLRFDDAATGTRELWFAQSTNIIARRSDYVVNGTVHYLNLAFPYRGTAGQVVNVHARSSTTCAISQGSFVVTRMGSGPQGVQGPQGIQGNTGPQGLQGPTGATGSAGSGFATYASLMS